MTSAADRAVLLRLARAAIVAHTAHQPVRAAEPTTIGAQRAAAFVTLHRGDQLRGCIGHLAADEPLSVIIPRCAIAASSEDPRFSAVTADEVPQLTIELSILGPLEPLRGPSEIEIGRHGLVVEQGWHRGLLLPQVATEWQWDAETFLAQTCRKAGLPLDAWKHGATLWRFEAEVFGENDARA
jgi:AmmeMemoRadiSam system protein A